MNVDDFGFGTDTIPPDFRRDQWDRPLIRQPNGTSKGYTRCSSAAKTIEDTFNLERHGKRNVAYGMAYDSSLVARIIAIGGDPSTWTKEEKKQVNTICDDALAAAKAHKAADIGVAIHHLTHRLDRGEEVIAGPYQADLDAYRQALLDHGLIPNPDYTECRMVNDLLEMAGTCDRILKDGDLYRVADIKTGATIDYGGLGWAAQLAAYAGGVLYDPLSDERISPPPIDQTVGYIIHLPAGQGRCDLYEVDLVAGHRAAELANEIRAVRKASKQWIQPLPARPLLTKVSSAEAGDREAPNRPSSVSTSAEDRRAALLRRYQAMSPPEQLAFCDLHINPDDLDAIEIGLDSVDAFNVVLDPRHPLSTPTVEPPQPPNEGGPVSDVDIKALHARFDRLPLDAQLWTGQLVAQGKQQHDFRIKDRPTQRRYNIYLGLLALAEAGEEWTNDDIIRDLLNVDIDDPFTTGALLAQLDAVTAAEFADKAHDYTHAIAR